MPKQERLTNWLFYAYSSAYAGTFTGTNFFRLELAVYREEAAGLYYDMQAVYEAADLLPEDNLSGSRALKHWKDA